MQVSYYAFLAQRVRITGLLQFKYKIQLHCIPSVGKAIKMLSHMRMLSQHVCDLIFDIILTVL